MTGITFAVCNALSFVMDVNYFKEVKHILFKERFLMNQELL